MTTLEPAFETPEPALATPELVAFADAVHEALRLPNLWRSDATPSGPGALRLARRNLVVLQAARAAIAAGHGFDDFLAVLEDAKAVTPLARAEVRRLAEAAYVLVCEGCTRDRDTAALDADLAGFSDEWFAHRRRTGRSSEWLRRLIQLNLQAFEDALEAAGAPVPEIVRASRTRRAVALGREG